MSLAVATGVPPAVWIEEGHEVMQTACLVLAEQDKDSRRSSRGGEQSG